MCRYFLFALILLALLACPLKAQAQGNTTGLVVATCNSPTFNVGNPGPFTVDAHGNLCTNGTGGGGGSVTQGTTPWIVGVTQWGGGTLGAMANYGTSPGAVLVPGVNAFITNTHPVTQSGTWNIGTVTTLPPVTQGTSPWVVSNGGTFPVQATLSAETTKVIGTVNQGTSPWLTSGTVTANQGTSPWVSNISQFGGNNIATGTGAGGNGIPRVTVSNDSTVGLTAGTAAIGTVTGNVNITPTDCSGTITTGGAAQNAFGATATIHGFTIANIDSTAGSGEPLWISFTGTAAASSAASYPLPAPAATTFSGMGSYTSPLGYGLNTALSVIAATTGHKFSCTRW